MAAVVGTAWRWLRSWGSSTPQTAPPAVCQKQRGGVRGWVSWVVGGWRKGGDQTAPVEEYWEAPEDLQASSWWSISLWPRKAGGGVQRGGPQLEDADGDRSDYGTPPPSPTPSRFTSPFRFFARSWKLEIVPEHYDICFNFLRHLFDLFVVGFLWTVSPPVKLVLEVLGVQGALRLWFHGMAMFLVSTAGMAGILWLVQEYLPQFALIYGIIQALVISVSVRQSVILGVEEDQQNLQETEEEKEAADF